MNKNQQESRNGYVIYFVRHDLDNNWHNILGKLGQDKEEISRYKTEQNFKIQYVK